MAGFRQTDGSDGCPPTETPPASYTIPFRFDSAGRLWITSCFKGVQYFGSARFGLGSSTVIGSATAPVISGALAAVDGSGLPVSAGTYTRLNITNSTECSMEFLLGHDTVADMETDGGALVTWHVAAHWNSAHHSLSSYSNPRITGSATNIRMVGGTSANPHDAVFESTGTPGLVLAAGASATIDAKMFIEYSGTPTGTEYVHSAAAAIRVYGYVA